MQAKTKGPAMNDALYTTPGKLGFGLMRLPRKGVRIDVPQVCQMVDLFLEAGGTYSFRVKAYPVDESAASESEWSNIQTVTLTQSYKRGDVNGDGNVDIADLTLLVNILLETPAADDVMLRADVNEDGNVEVADLTSLINILLEQ